MNPTPLLTRCSAFFALLRRQRQEELRRLEEQRLEPRAQSPRKRKLPVAKRGRAFERAEEDHSTTILSVSARL